MNAVPAIEIVMIEGHGKEQVPGLIPLGPFRTGPRGLGLKGMGREEYQMLVMREVMIEVMKVSLSSYSMQMKNLLRVCKL